MTISNVNSYMKNMSFNNKESIVNNKQCNNLQGNQNILNKNSKINTIKKQENNQNLDDIMKQKIKKLKMQLTASQDSEEEIQNGMLVLQERRQAWMR